MTDSAYWANVKKRFDRFFPKSSIDPRSTLPEIKEHPPYWLGERFTPIRERVESARAREKARRSGSALTRWRRLTAQDELDEARIIIAAATSFGSKNNVCDEQGCRTVRSLIFDNQAEIFRRDLSFCTERYLLEFRHPDIKSELSGDLVGARFLGLSKNAWKTSDFIGVWLDGNKQNIYIPELTDSLLFDENGAVKDNGSIEDWIRFYFDHCSIIIAGAMTQFYVVADEEDFVFESLYDEVNSETRVLRALSAQFRVVLPTSEVASEIKSNDVLFDVLKLHPDGLVPPVIVSVHAASEEEPAHVVVFTTVLFDGHIFYACWKVYSNGQINVMNPADPQEGIRQITEDDTSLPVSAFHSFATQRSALTNR